MYQGTSIAVVVPAYNEEDHVGHVVETLPSYVDRAYVVDDASTDATWAVICEHADRANRGVAPLTDGGSADPRVVPLRHEHNRGVGGAIKTGYRRALQDGYDVVAVLGGDGQMDPSLLSSIIGPVVDGTADYSKGTRLRTPEDRAEMPVLRVVGNYLLTVMTRVASGYWTISDPQNGYTAVSRRALEAIPLEEMYEYYGYCNDLLVKLNAAERRVADVPMPATYGEETSHIELSRYVPRVSWMLARNFVWRLRARYLTRGSVLVPAAYAAGVVGLLVSVLATVATLAGAVPGVAAVLPLVLGVVATLAGVALDGRANAPLVVRLDRPS